LYDPGKVTIIDILLSSRPIKIGRRQLSSHWRHMRLVSDISLIYFTNSHIISCVFFFIYMVLLF